MFFSFKNLKTLRHDAGGMEGDGPGADRLRQTFETAGGRGARKVTPLPLDLCQPLTRLTVLLVPALLAACGFNGTDSDDGERQPTEAAAVAPADPELAVFETRDLPDPTPRPEMQLQVVLDQQGFGPGVIDGGMGLSTRNALRGFQEAHSLEITGEPDTATRQALERWRDVPATRVVRIPESWAQLEFADVPEEPEDQAKMERLGYESLGEKLAERFHTTVEVLQELNPGGRPAGMEGATGAETAAEDDLAAGGQHTAQGNANAAARANASPTPAASATPQGVAFRPGQLVRVPNIGLGSEPAAAGGDSEEEREWHRTLASLGVSGDQSKAARVVVDKSERWLKAYDDGGKLLAMFTVTSGSGHDPLPLGEWGITGVGRNPPFRFDPDLFWDVPDSEDEQHLPPGPNGPVGVVWIDLTKEHYGIHGTPEPQTIGRTESHGCVRLTNWDAARLAGMVDTSTDVVFQA
jgi:lipoprotein-anchoring transpeptidase ErfK/SrfK